MAKQPAMNREHRNKLILVVIAIFNLFVYNNCVARQPQMTNRSIASAIYTHQAADTVCNNCHSAARPQYIIGPSYTFDHMSSLYGGQNDCSACHTSQITWAGGIYSHSPQPTTCQNCHSAQRPTVLIGTPSFDHSVNGMADCYGCHAASTTSYNVMSDWSGAVATPSSLIGSKSINVTVGTPTWTSTTISTVTNASKPFPLQMLHTSLQIPAGFTGACTNCHSGASATPPDYKNGVYHASITTANLAQPTLCIDCHLNTAPTDFVGPAGTNRTPASAEMRHDAVTWAANSSGVWAPTTTQLVTQECTVCHNGITPGTTGGWNPTNATATYHAKLTAAAIAQPTSCLDCHANNRPTGATGAQNYLHTSGGGLGDCVTCHATGVASNSYTSWTNTGSFSHAGQTACVGCHASNRPANTTGWFSSTWSSAMTTFNLSTHANGTDCYSCHSSTLTATNNAPSVMTDWKGGNYTHSPAPATCVGCHAYPSGTAAAPVPTLTGSGLTFMDHSGYGGQECAGCHVSPPNYTSISGWGGAAATPAGLVNGTGAAWNNWSVSVGTLAYTTGAALSTGKVTAATVSLPQQMLHSSSQVPAGIINSCATCHVSGLVATSGTQFHTHVAKAQITSCASCHTSVAVPNGIVGPLGTVSTTNQPNMVHSVKYSSGTVITTAQDCAVCHNVSVGTSWKDGVFHAKIGANAINTCTSCHFQRMPTSIITLAVQTNPTVDKFSHTSAVVKQDCALCHLPAQAGPTGTWVTTNRIHAVITTTTTAVATPFTECKSCHNSMPSPDAWGKHNKHSGYDCIKCHSNAYSSNSIGNNWITGTSTNGSPCNQCH